MRSGGGSSTSAQGAALNVQALGLTAERSCLADRSHLLSLYWSLVKLNSVGQPCLGFDEKGERICSLSQSLYLSSRCR